MLLRLPLYNACKINGQFNFHRGTDYGVKICYANIILDQELAVE